MPRVSRPTLKPNASSAWVTALSEERDWANAPPPLHSATAATLNDARLRHDRICRTPSSPGFRRGLIICTRGGLEWRTDANSPFDEARQQGRDRFGGATSAYASSAKDWWR